MTALNQMTLPQKAVAAMNQSGLDDPTEYGMILVAYNQATRTYIYHHDGWQLYYHYHNPNCGYWTARNIKMGLVLEFGRGEPIPIMIAAMDQAASDGGDLLLSGLPPTMPDTLEEYPSLAEHYGLAGEVYNVSW